MTISLKSIAACGCLGAVVLAAAACSPRSIPPKSVTDLMEDRVTLDGVLMKCNQNESKARSDTECLNARVAIERLATQNEQEETAKRAAEFERSREQLRLSQEKQRQEEEAKNPKVDAYHLPLVPVDPAPPAAAPAPAASNTSPPVARESNP
ncbi:MAG: EexN family lipoprotein [Steroidobacteraceae bacterium]